MTGLWLAAAAIVGLFFLAVCLPVRKTKHGRHLWHDWLAPDEYEYKRPEGDTDDAASNDEEEGHHED